ncbi:hypothetical protein [Aeromicrobium sp. CF3.5]|uniref:hypothetical protein n=1 Tax=Aeromicrobium sp. CF3.5 TaxID=3373078 RepID=UPI003EE7B8C0
MTATYEPTTADEVYTSALEPPPRGLVGRVVCSALDLWCAMTGGLLELTSAADVVVRRRSDSAEELRVAGGPPTVSLALLEQVRIDLIELGPDQFRSEWGID